MGNVFDWHKWNAETYEKPEDIIRAFDALGVCGKRIAGIRIIGFTSKDAQYAARRAQYEAGGHSLEQRFSAAPFPSSRPESIYSDKKFFYINKIYNTYAK